MIIEFSWDNLWMSFEGFQNFHGHGPSPECKRGLRLHFVACQLAFQRIWNYRIIFKKKYFGTPLEFNIIHHYENALNIYWKLFVDLITFFFIFFIGCFKFHDRVCNANCTSNFSFFTLKCLKYLFYCIFTHLYPFIFTWYV